MDKSQLLIEKIQAAAILLIKLQKENQDLQKECANLRMQVTLLTTENSRAQKLMAEHDQLKRIQQSVTNKVERALEKLNQLGQPA